MLFGALAATACSNPDIGGEAKYPTGYDRTMTNDDIYGETDSIFGKGGWSILGGKDKDKNDGSSGIGVNSYLWRAALDTVSFMPLASADPFGGVIITDYYEPDDAPNERFKANVFILGRELKSNNIQIKLYRQILKSGRWVDQDVSRQTELDMEDAVLTRARQLRVADREK